MNKQISIEQAIEKIEDGMTIMVGGFLAVGSPNKLVDALVEKNVKDLTLIANDTAFIDKGVGKLIVNKQVKKVIVSHIGTNKETGRQMNENELEVELVPQGTFVERIRAAGFGLGGVLTPTGVNTIVEEGKKKIEVEGKDYLLETPLKADIALLKGETVDKKGNIRYDKTARNFNPTMATAADTVIVEADNLVEIGEIDPENVITPSLFVDYIVDGGEK
ncbi:acetate CoA-transferase subunit alpha [Senegalia massiliensis]|uniref:Acetate CoA-transferase subunit alpha n=1 Tax=Senegalia massiliensis TaxID=1720316 RepID=A0A845QVE0_9CLOT|nr:acetate CoA-transferase subunit alpha [Senegalia massiliensis]NBI06040.1 acetate CoA-transferase subunit alpha [Senegalia massiliensis]